MLFEIVNVKQLDRQQGKHAQAAGGKGPSDPFYFYTPEKEAE